MLGGRRDSSVEGGGNQWSLYFAAVTIPDDSSLPVTLAQPASLARVVFMGTPDFAVPTLRALLSSQDVVGVFTRRDQRAGRGRTLRASPVKEVAGAAGVPVFQPRSLRKGADAGPGLDALRALEPDVIVVAAYGLILPLDVLDAAPHGALNVHASLLPRWRGAAPIQHAIAAGDPESGATIMRMDEGLDTGPMISRRATPIGPRETAGELTERLAVLGAALLAETLPRWIAGELTPLAQDPELATLAPSLRKAQGRIDWSRPATELARHVRAMAPWPGAFTFDPDGGRLKVHAATALDAPINVVVDDQSDPSDAAGSHASTPHAVAHPGRVALIEHEGRSWPAVACGSGWLRLDVAQAAGGKPMPGDVLLRGRPTWPGSLFLAAPDAAATTSDRA